MFDYLPVCQRNKFGTFKSNSICNVRNPKKYCSVYFHYYCLTNCRRKLIFQTFPWSLFYLFVTTRLDTEYLYRQRYNESSLKDQTNNVLASAFFNLKIQFWRALNLTLYSRIDKLNFVYFRGPSGVRSCDSSAFIRCTPILTGVVNFNLRIT